MERHHLRTKRKEKTAVTRICRECHKTIHGLFEDRELKKGELTMDGLLADERFQRALVYIRKVKVGGFMRMRERKR